MRARLWIPAFAGMTDIPGSTRIRSLSSRTPYQLVVRDLDLGGVRSRPPEADPVLIVDANAVLPCAVATQCFQSVSRRHSQRFESSNGVELCQLPPRHRPDRLRAGAASNATAHAIEDIDRAGFLNEAIIGALRVRSEPRAQYNGVRYTAPRASPGRRPMAGSVNQAVGSAVGLHLNPEGVVGVGSECGSHVEPIGGADGTPGNERTELALFEAHLVPGIAVPGIAEWIVIDAPHCHGIAILYGHHFDRQCGGNRHRPTPCPGLGRSRAQLELIAANGSCPVSLSDTGSSGDGPARYSARRRKGSAPYCRRPSRAATAVRG